MPPALGGATSCGRAERLAHKLLGERKDFWSRQVNEGFVASDLGQQMRHYCATHQLIAEGTRGVIALSGGPDSLALAALLSQLARSWGLELRACHIDHGLREESAREVDQVGQLAGVLGIPFASRPLVGLRGAGGNLQERARDGRLATLQAYAGSCDAAWIALGHTLDDQAETVLMRILRGTGSDGLAAMAPRRGHFVRPLLWASKAALRAWLLQVGLEPLDDPSNRNPRFLRSRVRHGLLPALAAENPRIERALVRLAASATEDSAALAHYADLEWQRIAVPSGGEGGTELRLRVEALRAAPVAIAHRILRRACAALVGDGRRVDRAHILALVRCLSSGAEVRAVDLPGLRVEREQDALVFRPPRSRDRQVRGEPLVAAAVADGAAPFFASGVGRYRFCETRDLVISEVAWEPGGGPCLAARAIHWPLLVRGPRRGERIAIGTPGGGGHRRVSRVLIDAKVPRQGRPAVRVLAQGEEIVMIVGLRTAEGYRPQPGERAYRVAIEEAVGR